MTIIFIVIYALIGSGYFLNGMCDPTPSIRENSKVSYVVFFPFFLVVFLIIGFGCGIAWMIKTIKKIK